MSPFFLLHVAAKQRPQLRNCPVLGDIDGLAAAVLDRCDLDVAQAGQPQLDEGPLCLRELR
jgi:hypothetical protein